MWEKANSCVSVNTRELKNIMKDHSDRTADEHFYPRREHAALNKDEKFLAIRQNEHTFRRCCGFIYSF